MDQVDCLLGAMDQDVIQYVETGLTPKSEPKGQGPVESCMGRGMIGPRWIPRVFRGMEGDVAGPPPAPDCHILSGVFGVPN